MTRPTLARSPKRGVASQAGVWLTAPPTAAMKHPWRRIVVVCVLATGLLPLASPRASAITPKQLANKVLRLDPRNPADVDLFTSKFQLGIQGFYPAGSSMSPASGPVLAEPQVRTRLKTFLNGQFNNDGRKVNAALALFDASDTKGLIPEPTLRAAVIGMKGTLLQPTINYLLNGGAFSQVRYGGVSNPSAVAQVTGSTVIVNRRYDREDFRHLIGVMGHESLHDDNSVPGAEEAILTSLTAMTYLQVLSKHPERAHTGTELARQMNTFALLFLNSREHGSPTSEVNAPTGRGVASGSPRNEPDIWSVFDGDATTSPASAPLGQITRSLGVGSASRFSLATAKSFKDLNDSWLSDVGRVQISVLLRLVSVKTIANKTGLSRSEVKRKLRLGPYLDAIK